MSRETLGYVRLIWKCPNCGGKNPGPQKTCSGCGNPQPENVPFEQLELQNLISDQTEIGMAKTGADIHCGYCDARNPAQSQVCTQCGADLKSGKFRPSGQVLGAFKSGLENFINCPSCGTPNNEKEDRCTQCGYGLGTSIQQGNIDRPLSSHPRKMGVGAFIIMGLIILTLCGISVWTISNLGKRDAVSGTVQNTRWERSITIEEFGPLEKEGWKEDIPGAAQVGNCEKKYHHTQSDPTDSSEKVCGTPFTVDKGSGYGEVVQDCEYKVYLDFCSYTIEDWKPTGNAVQSGVDLNPQWPNPTLENNQRLGDKSELYVIMFNANKGDYEYSTTDSDLFSKAEIGSTWKLDFNGFDQLISVEPAQ
jgi:hypothetical protein